MAPSFRAVAAAVALVAVMANTAFGTILTSCVGGTQVPLCSTVTTEPACNTSYTYYSQEADGGAPLYYAPCGWNTTEGRCVQFSEEITGASGAPTPSPNLFSVSSQCCFNPPVPVCIATGDFNNINEPEQLCGPNMTAVGDAGTPINGILSPTQSWADNSFCKQYSAEGKTCSLIPGGDHLNQGCDMTPCIPQPVTSCNYTVPPGKYTATETSILNIASTELGVGGLAIGSTLITRNDLAELDVTTSSGNDMVLSFGSITDPCVLEGLVEILANAAETHHIDQKITVESCTNILCDSIDACPSGGGSAASSGRGRRSAGPSAFITVRKSGLSGGAIAGIVIGSVAGAALIGVAVWQKWFRKKGGKVLPGGRMYTFL